MLSHLFELRDEIQQFLREAEHELAGYFDEPEFIQALAYQANVFTSLNELRQGRKISILVACEKLSAFKEKTLLWIKRIKKENFINFPSLEERLMEGASVHPDFASQMVEHLQLLCTSFVGYFLCGELQTCGHWVRHPFKMNSENIDDSDTTKDRINMKNNWESKWNFPIVAWSTFGLLNWKRIQYWQKRLLLCWCLSRQLTCAKQDIPACFISNQKPEKLIGSSTRYASSTQHQDTKI